MLRNLHLTLQNFVALSEYMNFTGVLILKAAIFFVIDIKTLKQSVSAVPVSCLLKFYLSIVL